MYFRVSLWDVKMNAKILLILFLLVFSLSFESEASLKIENLNQQSTDLDSLLNEINAFNSKKNGKRKRKTEDDQTVIDWYMSEVRDLQGILDEIKVKNADKAANNADIQKLVEAYNEKLKGLEKNWKQFKSISKSRNSKTEELPGNYMLSGNNQDDITIVSLNCGKEGITIKDAKRKFRPLEIIELLGSASSSDNSRKLPLENER